MSEVTKMPQVGALGETSTHHIGETSEHHPADLVKEPKASPHPTTGSDTWCTPAWLAEALGPFDLDPCSNARSHICARGRIQLETVESIDAARTRLSERTRLSAGTMLAQIVELDRLTLTHQGDGLGEDWSSGSVFVNPPYSNVLPWARKLAVHDGPWCALLKLDPTTRWWSTLMSASPQVACFRKRIKFETDAPGKGMLANFPSVLVYSAWRPPRALVPHLWLPTYEDR